MRALVRRGGEGILLSVRDIVASCPCFLTPNAGWIRPVAFDLPSSAGDAGKGQTTTLWAHGFRALGRGCSFLGPKLGSSRYRNWRVDFAAASRPINQCGGNDWFEAGIDGTGRRYCDGLRFEGEGRESWTGLLSNLTRRAHTPV
jgi:hypothetical protein